jgi:hypothetical protein
MAKQVVEPERDLRKQATEIIRKQIDRLDHAGGASQVRVWHLWENHYRVNIYVTNGVGNDQMTNGTASARIAQSYFVTVDESGTITASAPELPAPSHQRGKAGNRSPG